MQKQNNVPDTGVQVLDRAFKIIDIIAYEQKELTGADITERAGLNRTTTYRLLEALVAHGYVEKTENGFYHLGNKLISLAGHYINSLELITIAQPYLWELSSKLQLSSYMAVLDGLDVVYVARADYFQRRNIFNEIGWRAPAYATAHGLVLLSQYSSDMLDRLLNKIQYIPLAKNTICSSHQLKQTLREVRHCGYAIDDESFENGMRCIGAPIFNYCDEAIASISVSGNLSQITAEKFDVIAREVVATANMISQKMGYCVEN